jgi:hypothetical protein
MDPAFCEQQVTHRDSLVMINWTNMMSVLLKALALGTAGALAEPCTI